MAECNNVESIRILSRHWCISVISKKLHQSQSSCFSTIQRLYDCIMIVLDHDRLHPEVPPMWVLMLESFNSHSDIIRKTVLIKSSHNHMAYLDRCSRLTILFCHSLSLVMPWIALSLKLHSIFKVSKKLF